jgi:hypothetical protein
MFLSLAGRVSRQPRHVSARWYLCSPLLAIGEHGRTGMPLACRFLCAEQSFSSKAICAWCYFLIFCVMGLWWTCYFKVLAWRHSSEWQGEGFLAMFLGSIHSCKFNSFVHGTIVVCPLYNWTWKSQCIMIWWIVEICLREDSGITDETHCVLCPGRQYEHMDHLFFPAISV